MASLSKAHRLVLTTAAERADGALLPLPDELAVRGRARRLMLQGLIKRGLIVGRPAQDDQPAWAQGDGEPSIALEITAQGRALVGSTARAPAGHDHRPAVRPGTKQALLVDLLRRRHRRRDPRSHRLAAAHRPSSAHRSEKEELLGDQHAPRRRDKGLLRKPTDMPVAEQ